MLGDRFFVDSNIVLYAFGNDLAKKFIAASPRWAGPHQVQHLTYDVMFSIAKSAFSFAQTSSPISPPLLGLIKPNPTYRPSLNFATLYRSLLANRITLILASE